MDLKEKLVSSFLAFENRVDIDAYVHDVRSDAIKIFEEKGFPSKRRRLEIHVFKQYFKRRL